jgi:ATP/maltotriose-dependent transcriptional regulator MalT
VGNRINEHFLLIKVGQALLRLGSNEDARRHAEQAQSISRELGSRWAQADDLILLSQIAHQGGRQTQACRYAEQALEYARASANLPRQANSLTCLAHALSAQDRFVEAKQAYEQALQVRLNLGAAHYTIECLAGLARVALELSDLERARACVDQALEGMLAPSLIGASEMPRIYLMCYQTLRALEDPRAAGLIAAAHASLQEQAERIGDASLRRAFLENVPAHREIIAEVERARQLIGLARSASDGRFGGS